MIGKLPRRRCRRTSARGRCSMTRRSPATKSCIDVYPDVIAGGILLLPKDLKRDEKRPVVVCQHGLEGVPMDTITRIGARRTSTTNRSPPSWRSAASSSTRRRIRTAATTGSACIQRQVEPAEAIAVQLHHPPARADARLAGDAAVCRSPADRLLWALLRRQDGRARAADSARAVRLSHLLGRLQRVGPQERHAPTTATATSSPASTKCSNGTWATWPTTPSWRA